MKIHMSPKEIELFTAFLNSAKGYFEFGMGGSTKLASDIVKGDLYAVDSDKAWVDLVKSEMTESSFKRELIHVDIGPTKAWGFPVSSDAEELFPNYHSRILSIDNKNIDLCFVDGRFRVACFLQALRHLGPETIIGIHDYRRRGHYHIVEKFARPIAEIESLTFFIKRFNMDMKEVEATLGRYMTLVK